MALLLAVPSSGVTNKTHPVRPPVCTDLKEGELMEQDFNIGFVLQQIKVEAIKTSIDSSSFILVLKKRIERKQDKNFRGG